MSLLFRLLLGHVVGDFVLQPLALVLWKRRSRWGGVVHASVVALSTALFLGSDLAHWWPWLLLLWACHVVIDESRVSIVKNSASKSLHLFLIDQGLHVLVIFLLWGASANWQFAELMAVMQQGLSLWDRLVVYLVGFVTVAWIGPILEMEAIATLAPPPAVGEGQPAPSLRIAMLDRILGFAERLLGASLLMTGHFWFFPLAFLPRWIIQRREWQSFRRPFGVKMATSAVVALTVGMILWALPL